MRARQVYAAVVVFVTVLAGFVGNILYTNKVDRDAERRNLQRSRDICEVAVFIDDRQQKLTPTTEDQRQFYAKWHDFRRRLGC